MNFDFDQDHGPRPGPKLDNFAPYSLLAKSGTIPSIGGQAMGLFTYKTKLGYPPFLYHYQYYYNDVLDSSCPSFEPFKCPGEEKCIAIQVKISALKTSY